MVNNNEIRIKNSEIEGENRILEIEYLRISKIKIGISIVLSIITFGVYFIILKNFESFKKHMIFIRVKLENCTHVFIKNNNSININLISRSSNLGITFENQLLKYKYNNSEEIFEAIDYLPENITNEVF